MSTAELLERESDRPAYVRFERRPVESKRLSVEAGRSVSVDVDIALVTAPYSKDVFEQTVDKWLEGVRRNVKISRVPQRHLEYWEKSYESWKKGEESPVDGTPIREWSAISPAQIKNLIAMNILTVEDLAHCNDEGLRVIGMGGVELRRKANNWLQAADDHGPLTMKVTQLETENAQLQATVDNLIDKNKALMNQLENANQPIHPIEEVQNQGISVVDILPESEVHAPEESLYTPPDYKNSTHDELVAAHIETFGKKPHSAAKDETIRQKLTAY